MAIQKNKYAILDFHKEFPNEAACLDFVFKQKYPKLKGYYRIRTRKCYANSKGHQIYPLKGTIFEKSRTPLIKWFYALFLFSLSKHGISARELQRQLGVTQKCAWRIAFQIRTLMVQDKGKLFGVVEADETYFGGLRKRNSWTKYKVPIMGIVERGGRARAIVMKNKGEYQIVPFIERNVRKGSTLYSDGAPVYNIPRGYKRGVVMHSRKEYVRGDVHTNSIEGLWSQVKNSIRGTHKTVSKRHLQSYLDERVFSWNHRKENVFEALVARI